MALLIDQHRNEITVICQKYGIVYLGLFGSHARGESTKESDLDLLVEFDGNASLSLMDIVGIEQELSDTLRVPVDLVERRGLYDQIKPYVMEDLQNIYGNLS